MRDKVPSFASKLQRKAPPMPKKTHYTYTVRHRVSKYCCIKLYLPNYIYPWMHVHMFAQLKHKGSSFFLRRSWIAFELFHSSQLFYPLSCNFLIQSPFASCVYRQLHVNTEPKIFHNLFFLSYFISTRKFKIIIDRQV